MRYLLLASVALVLSGCATQTFHVNGGAGELTEQNMDMFFVNGLGQQKQTNAAAVCGGADRVIKVEVQQDFVDGLISGVSGGIVTPRKSRVYCRR